MSDSTEVKPTPVAKEKFLNVLGALGIQWTEQSGFYRVEGPKGRRLYVANTKTVRRVDVSGFEPEFGTRPPHQGVFGNVKAQLEMRGLSEEDILRNFGALCEHMMSLPPVEPKAKKEPKAPKASGPEVQVEDILPMDASSQAAREARLALIKRVAEEKGVGIAEETLEELTAPTEA